MKTPFVWIENHPWLITSFDLDPDVSGVPPLRDRLEHLLEHYSGSEILILRRLNDLERRILDDATTEREHETWARISAMSKAREDS